MYEIYGYTSLFLMAKQRLGMPIDIRFPQENGAVVYLYAEPGKKGEKIQTIDSPELESLKQTFHIVHIHNYEDAGNGAADSVTDHSALLRGYVILKNIEGEKLPELADFINEALTKMPPAARNLFEKRFLDFPKLLIGGNDTNE
jgi:transcriptional regulator of met regulon